MPSLALLLFSRNDGSGIAANVHALDSVVDEVLIVDSSDPDEFLRLKQEAGSAKVRWVRTFPTGCTEPLRPWALGQVASDRVLSLDSDEEASPELISALPNLSTSVSFFIPRYEEAISAYSYQLRLHRRDAVSFRGTIHESPNVEGPTERLAAPIRIVHHANYREYLGTGTRRAGYLRIEAYEHPFTGRRLRMEYRGRLARWLLDPTDVPISAFKASLLAASHRSRRYNPLNGARGNFLTGKYLARYVRARFQYFRSLPASEQQLAIAVANEIEAGGGVVEYLGLDRPGYIERLTASYPWDRRELEALSELLRYRHLHGMPMPDWSRANTPEGSAP